MREELITQAATLIRHAKRVIALTGAGISRPSGIPDFRSNDGAWAHIDPIEVASLHIFQTCPQRFYDWIRPFLDTLLGAQPNPAHRALAQLEHLGKLYAIITQNIDGLHQRAGSREVYELHGNLRQATCLRCGRQMPSEPLIGKIRRGQAPLCHCGGPIKPDVILFDEILPQGLFRLAQRALETCDVLLIAGTSLAVHPVSDMPLTALRQGARLIVINLEQTYLDQYADVVLHEDVAVALPTIVDQAFHIEA